MPGFIACSVCFGGRTAFMGWDAGGAGSLCFIEECKDLVVPAVVGGNDPTLGGTNPAESDTLSVFIVLPSGADDLEDGKLLEDPLCACLGNGGTLEVGLGII